MTSDIFISFQKKLKTTLQKLDFTDNTFFLEKKYSKIPVVSDKVCPKCKNRFYEMNIDICACGYSFVKEQNIKLWTLVGFTWLFIFGFIFFIFSSLSEVSSLVYSKLDKTNSEFRFVSPAGIQIVNSLKDSKYRTYIRTIYIHPKEENKLMVLINPVYRNMMQPDEKAFLKKVISAKWSEIYQKTNPDSDLKPVVRFANFG